MPELAHMHQGRGWFRALGNMPVSGGTGYSARSAIGELVTVAAETADGKPMTRAILCPRPAVAAIRQNCCVAIVALQAPLGYPLAFQLFTIAVRREGPTKEVTRHRGHTGGGRDQ